ncbi:uncharacterized protein LOC133038302 [Cannabis sativa]|uniref:uncharacterized protein LOC133038302 n=1 Tax=Cannabis sativa TaxID=3483 RepID=UPI0029CAAA4D|nr:uncharacterized protein LOC133038302 [Cannabis sativa]
MTGINPEIIVHRLQVDPNYPPKRQKRRKFAPERNQAINEEVQKLIENGFIKEVQYPDWLANVVIVKKKNGKFLGYLVTQRGIEANPAQIDSILRIPSPTCIKDVQKLTGRITALGRFISKSSERCHSFFNTLRKSKTFEWTAECEEALEKLKQYLTSPPLLSKPKDNENLFVYLGVYEAAIGAILVRSNLEKLALALIHAARKLRPYFQCHPITVLTTFPLKTILHKPELSGRLTKWAVELSEYDISYKPRTALKSQVLADFIADFTPNSQVQAEKELCHLTEGQANGTWELHVDGSSNVRGSGLGLVLTSPQGEKIEQAIRCGYKATNNEAGYEAMIAGVGLAKEMGAKRINVFSDSQLVVNQMQELQSTFDEFTIDRVPRENNSHAYALANLGSSIRTTSPETVPMVYLQWPAVWKKEEEEEVNDVANEKTWMTPIIEYLEKDVLPEDKNEARRVKAQAARFSIIRGKLYKRSYSGPYLRCVNLRKQNIY